MQEEVLEDLKLKKALEESRGFALKPVKPIAPQAGDFKMDDLIRFADIVEGQVSAPD
jgi:hypothetical protein